MPNHPLLREEQARKEVKAMIDSFQFDPDTPDPARLVIVVAGKEGRGKTHLACTMQGLGPVYLLDTEYRAGLVTRKFTGIKRATVKNWRELVAAVGAVVTNEPPGTIVIDSGSDIQQFAEYEYLEMAKLEKIWPQVLWGEIYGMCDALLNKIKFSPKPFNLVITARVKEEYVNDKGTGQYIPRLYDRIPYKADLVLQFEKNKPKQLEVVKDGFDQRHLLPAKTYVSSDIGLPGIINSLMQVRQEKVA